MRITNPTPPRVSVIMPCYNHQKYIDSAINSILDQSLDDFELIIVDDKSTDNSIDKIEHYRYIDKRIISICHNINTGPSSCRNDGIHRSNGKYISFCDADDVWFKDKLRIQLACIEDRNDIHLIYSDSLIIDSYGNLTGKKFSDIYKSPIIPDGNIFHKLCLTNFINLSTVLLRKECIEQTGYFHKDIKHGEDWLLWVNLAKYHKFHYLAMPLVKYRIHENSSNLKHRQLHNDRIKTYSIIHEKFPNLPISIKSEILYHIGRSYMSLNNNTNAVEFFLQAARLRKINPKYFSFYALYLLKGFFSRCV